MPHLSMRLEIGYQWNFISNRVEILNAQLHVSSVMATRVSKRKS